MKLDKDLATKLEYWSNMSKPDERLTNAETFEKSERVSPQRVITLSESDYAQLQSLVLKYGSGTGHGSSTNITLRVAVADAEYKWS